MDNSTQLGAMSYWIYAAKEPKASVNDPASRTPEHAAARSLPTGDMTVSEFIERKFLPEHIASKRTPGRHYQAILKHIIHPDLVDTIFFG